MRRPIEDWLRGRLRLSAYHLAPDDLREQFTFRLHPSGDGEGIGPDGVEHTRFRAWKEALRDTAPAAEPE